MASLVPNNPFDANQPKAKGPAPMPDGINYAGGSATFDESAGLPTVGTTPQAGFKGPAPMPGVDKLPPISEPFKPAPNSGVMTSQASPGSQFTDPAGRPSGGLIYGAQTTAAPAQPGSAYTPTNSTVNKQTETVSGQVDSILSKDSPLMQRARTLATQGMAQRGLVNSSMAQGAGAAAMIDRALPIAQQDAATYSQRSLANMDALNQAGQFNATQSFQANENNLQRNFQQRLAELEQSGLDYRQAREIASQETQAALNREFQAGQTQTQNEFALRMSQLEQQGLDYRQAREIASREAVFALEQQGINNRFDQELALKSSMFNAEQVNAERRQIIQNEADLNRLGIQIQANRQDIPTSFAANISNTTMNGVNAIMADPNLSADAKQTAIKNLTTYANAQLEWASKFYGVQIPAISSTPTGVASTASALAPTPAPSNQPVSTRPTAPPLATSNYQTRPAVMATQ